MKRKLFYRGRPISTLTSYFEPSFCAFNSISWQLSLWSTYLVKWPTLKVIMDVISSIFSFNRRRTPLNDSSERFSRLSSSRLTPAYLVFTSTIFSCKELQNLSSTVIASRTGAAILIHSSGFTSSSIFLSCLSKSSIFFIGGFVSAPTFELSTFRKKKKSSRLTGLNGYIWIMVCAHLHLIIYFLNSYWE